MTKIQSKILAIVILMAVVGALGVYTLKENIQTIVTASNQVINVEMENATDLSNIVKNFADIKGNLFIHVNGTTTSTYDLYEKLIATSMESVEVAMASYEERNAGNEEEIAAMEELRDIYNQYVTQYNKCIKYSREDNKESASALILQNMQLTIQKFDAGVEKLNEMADTNLLSSKEVVDDNVRRADTTITISIVLLILGIIIAGIICYRIVRPLNKAVKQLNEITDDIEKSNGDLTKRITVKTKDEIFLIAQGINRFLNILQEIIDNIAVASQNIASSSDNISASVLSANEGANDTSATLEELSAGMEEVSATVENVNDRMIDIKDAVEEIASSATEGTEYAKEIKNRARQLMEQAVESVDGAKKILEEIDEAVKTSVNNAKQISKISELTSDILGISSQTNLLALNASIEAARAGEAGRGFAVVADEIRILADSSRETANNIQVISTGVINDVNELITNTTKLLDFVNTKVIDDYEDMGNVGEKYYGDAEKFDELLTGFETSTKNLNDITSRVGMAINDISITVSESAKGVTQVATTTSDLVSEIGQIMDASNISVDTSNSLKAGISKFTTF